MKTVIAIGHKNPDTDSVVSAVAFATLVKEIKKPILGFSDFEIQPARAGSPNNETKFVFDYFNQELPTLAENIGGKEVVLLDHGEYSQSQDGIKEATIVGVLDHHKLGGLETAGPIFYRAEPVGSTSTIIFEMFSENNISLDKKLAGLLLAAVLSDTLKLTSPTTADQDRQAVKALSEISGENIDALAEKMFEAKSDITGISPAEIIGSDYKEYEAGMTKFGIGVWETMYPEKVKEKKEEILSALEKMKSERKMDLMFFALVDINRKNSELFIISEKEKAAAEKVFKSKAENSLIFLSGIVSRKKEMVPPLTNFLEKNENNR